MHKISSFRILNEIEEHYIDGFLCGERGKEKVITMSGTGVAEHNVWNYSVGSRLHETIF
jgi:hypothetical protein